LKSSLEPLNHFEQGTDPPSSVKRQRRLIHPIFLPHFGCPFRCVYCNQECVVERDRGGSSSSDLLGSFRAQLQTLLQAARPRPAPGEVALYGGTFTGLPPRMLIEILDTLTVCVERGIFSGVRFSTRPDWISPEVCSLLRNYPVSTVELGVQSFCDDVLSVSERGYDSKRAVDAAVMVRGEGWGLGIQLMTGLPGDSFARFKETVSRTITIQPDLVRIYPTLVMRDTRLASWFAEGRFMPLGLDEARDQCAWAYDSFLRSGIPVARMGLHGDPELMRPGNIVAGPFHPAFGYLVRVRWWRDRVDGRMEEAFPASVGRRLTLHVPERFRSEVIGPGRENLAYWQQKWRPAVIRVKGEKDWALQRFSCVCD
jgi:histone acetyltransferase (RNA polymerase elongator complex component)